MNFRHVAAATALALSASLASAAPVIEYLYFYDYGSREAINPSAVGTPDACSGEDVCSSFLKFNTKTGGELTVTGTTGAGGASTLVFQDQAPDKGGLGVIGYTPATSEKVWKWNSSTPSSKRTTGNIGSTKYGRYETVTIPAKWFGDDEIDKGETLTLRFDKDVSIAGMHFFTGDHKDVSGKDTFQLIVDGVKLSALQMKSYLTYDSTKWLTGQEFTFSTTESRCTKTVYGKCTAWGTADYYLGALKITAAPVTPVPEPETYALFLAGLAAVAYTVRRRRLG